MTLTEDCHGDRTLTVPGDLVRIAGRLLGTSSESMIMHRLCRLPADELVRVERLSTENPTLAAERLRNAFA
jgi:hypothetical protein